MFRRRIRELRGLRKVSQAEVAEHAGIGRTAYNEIETGTRRARLVDAVLIAEALGVPLGDLIAEEPMVVTTQHRID